MSLTWGKHFFFILYLFLSSIQKHQLLCPSTLHPRMKLQCEKCLVNLLKWRRQYYFILHFSSVSVLTWLGIMEHSSCSPLSLRCDFLWLCASACIYVFIWMWIYLKLVKICTSSKLKKQHKTSRSVKTIVALSWRLRFT